MHQFSKNNAILLVLILFGLIHPTSVDAQVISTSPITTEPKPPDCMTHPGCRALVEKARNLSKAKQHEAALVNYQDAYAIVNSPWLLINIGRMQWSLGRFDQAIKDYRIFLKSAEAQQNISMRSKAEQFLREAEADLAKHTPPPRVELSPPQAQSQATEATVAQLPTVTLPPEKVTAVPIYKKWWFWVPIGLVVAGGVTVGVVLGTQASSRASTPTVVGYYDPMF